MKKNILIGITASIAAYKSCEIISALNKQGFQTKACLSKEATHFIAPLTLQTLTGNEVFGDMFSLFASANPVHISLAEWADLILIAPATANCISKIATGICDDLLTCTAISTKAKILIAPAMNENMYNNCIIQENISKLKKRGVLFIGPKKGRLACGNEAMGHIEDTGRIVAEVKKIIASGSKNKTKL